jgi:hypothetical protein
MLPRCCAARNAGVSPVAPEGGSHSLWICPTTTTRRRWRRTVLPAPTASFDLCIVRPATSERSTTPQPWADGSAFVSKTRREGAWPYFVALRGRLQRSRCVLGPNQLESAFSMKDFTREMEAIRLDIETLRAMIDLALDRGAGAEDINLRACAQVLYERKHRLAELESITLYESRGGERRVE